MAVAEGAAEGAARAARAARDAAGEVGVAAAGMLLPRERAATVEEKFECLRLSLSVPRGFPGRALGQPGKSQDIIANTTDNNRQYMGSAWMLRLSTGPTQVARAAHRQVVLLGAPPPREPQLPPRVPLPPHRRCQAGRDRPRNHRLPLPRQASLPQSARAGPARLMQAAGLRSSWPPPRDRSALSLKSRRPV